MPVEPSKGREAQPNITYCDTEQRGEKKSANNRQMPPTKYQVVSPSAGISCHAWNADKSSEF